jgi:hypothetical protein
MPEPTAADVELFTGGRILADSVETYRALQRALSAVRNYCGWHVTPVKVGDVVILDGPGDSALALPTRQLGTLTSVVEDGITLSVSDLVPSVDPLSKGRVLRKKSGAYWTWKYGAITVTMTHGYADAPDWNAAVLSVVNEMWLAARAGVGAGFSVKRNRVDDTEREWFDAQAAQAAIPTVENLLSQYRLIPAV